MGPLGAGCHIRQFGLITCRVRSPESRPRPEPGPSSCTIAVRRILDPGRDRGLPGQVDGSSALGITGFGPGVRSLALLVGRRNTTAQTACSCVVGRSRSPCGASQAPSFGSVGEGTVSWAPTMVAREVPVGCASGQCLAAGGGRPVVLPGRACVRRHESRAEAIPHGSRIAVAR